MRFETLCVPKEDITYVKLENTSNGDIDIVADNGNYASIILTITSDGFLKINEFSCKELGLQLDKEGRIKIKNDGDSRDYKSEKPKLEAKINTFYKTEDGRKSVILYFDEKEDLFRGVILDKYSMGIYTNNWAKDLKSVDDTQRIDIIGYWTEEDEAILQRGVNYEIKN